MVKFQSTRPIRGATRRWRGWPRGGRISIHAPHTGRDLFLLRSRHSSDISIHAPHTGRDLARLVLDTDKEQFQSTRPIRGATYRPKTLFSVLKIFQSTRPIRGATSLSGWNFIRHRNFNPRAPYGARLLVVGRFKQPTNFNPRAPYGARLCKLHGTALQVVISIHAPHTGRDRTHRKAHTAGVQISIHAPHTGRDSPGQVVISIPDHFNPRAPYGARLIGQLSS